MALLAATLAVAAGCGTRAPAPRPPGVALQSASLQELVSTYNRNASAIHSMSLKLELTAKAGKKTYPRVNAYLLTQKPADIRMWGTFTLIGRLFDMASDGDHFQLSLPTRSQFFVGENDIIPARAANPLEKMRPQVILNALLVNPILPDQHVVLDPDSDGDEYDVLVLQPGGDGAPAGSERLLRRITFSRVDLLPHRQVLYDADQVHQTRASYSRYTLRAGIPIAEDITIQRPVEGYALRLQLTPSGISVNTPLTAPHTFDLQPPAGATIIKIGPEANAKTGQKPSPPPAGSGH